MNPAEFLPLTREQVEALAPEDQAEYLDLLEQYVASLSRNMLERYKPYPKQMEFHARGASFRERLLAAGNQLGKTLSMANESAMHLTGRYPAWWVGRRWVRPIVMLAGSESAELTRKGVQRLLLGRPEAREEWGTGTIPGDCLLDTSMRQGVADAVASIVVRHVSGGKSIVNLLSYDQGRTKWQADTVDLVWFDEEPPEDVYMEGITRTNATQGSIALTFTPLKGMSNVVKRFLLDKHFGTTAVTMTIDDALHFTPEQRAAIIAGYPAHEREARTKGIPSMGQGRIFPLADEAVAIEPFPLPAHWRRIAAIDFGWTHPTAVVWIAYDTDTDTAVIYDAYRAKEKSPAEHAMTVRAKGEWIPCAWPHDGDNATAAGAGKPLADQYREAGVAMLPKRASFPPTADGKDGGNSLEAGIQMLLVRMQTGRLKVFRHLEPWFEEFRLYHRDELGRPVDKIDDLLAATRYALMMLRYAKSKQEVELARGNVFGVGMGQVFAHDVLDPTIGY